MGLPMDFDDRQDHIDAQNQEYHPYQYQEDENNKSWAVALTVKQYGFLITQKLLLVSWIANGFTQGIIRPKLRKGCVWCRLRLVCLFHL